MFPANSVTYVPGCSDPELSLQKAPVVKKFLDDDPKAIMYSLDVVALRVVVTTVGGPVTEVPELWKVFLRVPRERPALLRQCRSHQIAQLTVVTFRVLYPVANTVMLERLNDRYFYEPTHHDCAGIVPTCSKAPIHLAGNGR